MGASDAAANPMKLHPRPKTVYVELKYKHQLAHKLLQSRRDSRHDQRHRTLHSRAQGLINGRHTSQQNPKARPKAGTHDSRAQAASWVARNTGQGPVKLHTTDDPFKGASDQ
eukprot:1161619-Pelagomonas_calceolata.AAC.5